jgi:hypothetical protein
MMPAMPASRSQAPLGCSRAGLVSAHARASAAQGGWRAQRFPLTWLALVWLLSACGLPPRPESGGSRAHCPDGSTRVTVNCALVSKLKARVLEANVGLSGTKLGLSVAYEDQALAQVTAATQQLALELDAKCAQYNACVIDAAGWALAEELLRQHVRLVSELPAEPDPVRGDAVWANAVPELAAGRLQLQVQVQARTADGGFVVHHSGQALESGHGLRVMVQTNIRGYVYLLLLSSQRHVVQLFPQPALGQYNPLMPETAVAIPPTGAGWFELDDRPGTEHIQIVASAHPLRDIEARLNALGALGAEGAEVLRGIASLLCTPQRAPSAAAEPALSSASCLDKRSRGIVLAPDPGPQRSGTPAATVIRAEPGDEVVVLQHEIAHVAAPGS